MESPYICKDGDQGSGRREDKYTSERERSQSDLRTRPAQGAQKSKLFIFAIVNGAIAVVCSDVVFAIHIFLYLQLIRSRQVNTAVLSQPVYLLT